MDITIYLPDEIGKWAKENDLGLSRMLREAVEDEKRRRDARAAVTSEGFGRVEVWDDTRDRKVAFEGREIGREDFGTDGDVTAYLTPKDAIAVYSDIGPGRLDVYDEFAAFAEDVQENWRGGRDLLAQVADALGEEYVEELDI